jgi:hypothetical protein
LTLIFVKDRAPGGASATETETVSPQIRRRTFEIKRGGPQSLICKKATNRPDQSLPQSACGKIATERNETGSNGEGISASRDPP